MHLRKITLVAALITTGVLALTGCSSNVAKTAESKSTSAVSKATPKATKEAVAITGSWIAATTSTSSYAQLVLIDPEKGTFTPVGEVETGGGTYPQQYVSGDSQYWIPSDDVSDETSINFIKVGDDRADGEPLDLVATMPGFGSDTRIKSIAFDLEKPHTLVVTAEMDDSGDVTAWGYDVTKPTEAPEKLAVAKYTDGRAYTDNVTGMPKFTQPTGEVNEEGEDIYSSWDVNYDYPWLKPSADFDQASMPSADAAVEITDGARWSFATRASDTDTTLFITKSAPGTTTFTAVGKPIQQLPSGTHIDWVRPLGK